MEDGILYRVWEDVDGEGQHKWLQLSAQKLVLDVLQKVHSTPTGGRLVQNCEVCASRKSPQQHRRAPIQIVTSGSPMQRVAMDIMGPFLGATHISW